MSNAPTKAANKSDKDTSVEDLSRQIETLKKDLSNLTTTMADLGKSEAQRAVSRAKETGAEVRAKGEDHLRDLRLRAETYGEEAGTYVREQPAMALGLAAAVGLLAGMILSGRR